MDKPTELASSSGLLFNSKKECTTGIRSSMGSSPDHASERSEAQKNTYFLIILYDFIHEVQEQAQSICGYDDQKLPLVGG